MAQMYCEKSKRIEKLTTGNLNNGIIGYQTQLFALIQLVT